MNITVADMKKIKWEVLEENEPISLYPCLYPGWSGIIERISKILGKAQRNNLNLHRKNNGIIFVDHKEWKELGAHTLRKILKNPKWGTQLIADILQYADALTEFSSKIYSQNLKKLSLIELYQLYKTYLEKETELYDYATPPVYLDLYKPHLTNYLVAYLDNLARRNNFSKRGKELFALLTIPRQLSKVQLEEKALLRLAAGRPDKNLLKQHADQFRYMGYNFEGPAFPDSYFAQRVAQARRDKLSPQQQIKIMTREKIAAAQEERKLIRRLKIDKKYQVLLAITKGLIYSKEYRKMSLVESYYQIEPLYKELARRFGLSLAEIRNCLLTEIELMAKGKIKRPKDLAARMKGFIFVVLDGQLPGEVIVDHRLGQMKEYLLKTEDFSEVNSFHGQAASLGKARGRVKIISTIKDLKKMRKGDILVSQMTNPDLVPAMKLAAAIVTDLGGITSHAAIVSRELRKPCVIGTKIATKVLKDGDMIEVDANNATVKKL
ncbi:MAG: hypothetical protein A3J07_03805 [Candidatus Doudnabacteria bacterium RIFCSPLOWO2_02_FULL_49_13]|uniref:PEP-utilising enzyme mobile domain-containing protein n=1 Tax=Candidatus Doudnabacteria bacterium RIFCSPHIGHO2_12_FULL_48_16 TaxID=1817838 RepID=A0A1F5PJC0_9BACT|nr:MAG: hypothetical protein A3B77_02615 [Candidatus Doudnabacteria bacterium RIFCSPHIGHO2_02_FULL_49_24]OGE89600.1 MAG: hypothetical protein A2760_03820 [Candidatus Doudnabacteria bacterium RIFCSPHIGHO2_01_FULL_50_67]OGE90043.1 MAG: hypothetical protein A3E29_02950 [Candidatus Doudnabacteria bacterium RIFCSPHIGHO2_12_FULL_48_16]OGE96616.1 MAG: hypothetical protein A2990_00260 [Candidatus Doudnabacteria bacterium RIFCSPLOWO2_01_FULL_49_40]OGF03186.1 MAG: hypothetical protein A3J07_03805 [Candid